MKLSCSKSNRLFIAVLMVGGLFFKAKAQPPLRVTDYNPLKQEGVLDSLRNLHGKSVFPMGSGPELATLLALGHYPELQGNRIRIRYKKNVKHPITASYSFWNIFRLRKNHQYVLLIKPGSFVDQLSLNRQVAVLGHELAHFVYYRQRPAIAMVPWGFRYLTSQKFRYDFESGADFSAIDHGLGWQLMELSMYISYQEVLLHMEKQGFY